MKSDAWLTDRVTREGVRKRDIAHVREMVLDGKSDDEILVSLRERMASNARGLRSYIRQEKVSGLMLKLSFRVHWVFALPVIEKWLDDRERLVGWSEPRHAEKIDEKALQLRRILIDSGCSKVSTEYVCSGRVSDEAMSLLQSIAEMVLGEIEAEGNGHQGVKVKAGRRQEMSQEEVVRE